MLSAWARPIPARFKLPDGTLPLVALVLLLVICLGNSTVAAQWVPGANGLTLLALVAALVMGILALIRRLPGSVALGIGLLLGPVAAYVSAHGTLVRSHPDDPGDPLALVGVWAGRIVSGEAANDTSFYAYLLCLLFWVVGGWLCWCSLRWRQPLLGLVPGAAAFATTVLNFPADQNGYVVAFLALTLGVLLWTSYVRQIDSARRRRVRLSGDAHWDFWESGVVVMAAVIAIGLILPPLSSADRTVDIENGSFRGWAELQQRLNHPVAFGSGATGGTSTGFASLARLAGPIQKTSGVVFTYTIDGSYGGPRYFRGFNLDSTSTGTGGPSWRYSEVGAINLPVEKDTAAPYAETYQQMAGGTFKLQMLKPPDRAPDVLFYPGTLLKADRGAVAHNYRGGQPPPSVVPADRLDTLDRLSVGRNGGAGSYKVSVQYSTATEDQLRTAGTDYPVWLDAYRNFAGAYRQGADGAVPSPTTSFGYRSRATLQRIQDLARRITAGRDKPYDQATAIEAYLRSNFQYTLTPTEPPAGVDPLEYFLFTSREGYCEYFASSMGDLLRSLGIPTRLVNGYGAGSYDEKLGRYVVKESDAHTWVEAYFPGYGWIPFEPTPDGTYFPIPRGTTAAVCAVDSEVCNAGDTTGAGTGEVNPRPDKGDLLGGDAGLGGGGLSRSPVPGGFPVVVLGLLLVLAAAWLAASRYLRPRTVSGVWKRVFLLSGLAGVRTEAGETPLEFGARLAREIPEAARPARELAERFAIAAYAPREVAVGSRPGVLAAWEELRPLLLRRVRGRVRLAS
ncbi:MAG TPA: transglutaminase domain-containing protein [Candidatus Dormibacteraeota bacterium]